jgi:hypothetical protein
LSCPAKAGHPAIDFLMSLLDRPLARAMTAEIVARKIGGGPAVFPPSPLTISADL